jgi:hypothetical protein
MTNESALLVLNRARRRVQTNSSFYACACLEESGARMNLL